MGCAYICAGAQRVQKRALDLPNLKSQVVVSNTTWVLGTKFRSSAPVVYAFKCWAISPAPTLVVLMIYSVIFLMKRPGKIWIYPH